MLDYDEVYEKQHHFYCWGFQLQETGDVNLLWLVFQF